MEAADGRFAKAAKALRSAVDSNFTARVEKEHADRFQPAARALLDAVDRLAAAQRAVIDAAAAGVHRQKPGCALDAGCVFAVAALVMSVLLSTWLSRRISHPIAFASNTAVRVASFNLAQEIRGHSRDEAGELLAALGRMQQNLRRLVAQLGASAHALHDAASEMAQGNHDLSCRAEETASGLDRTAAGLDRSRAP